MNKLACNSASISALQHNTAPDTGTELLKDNQALCHSITIIELQAAHLVLKWPSFGD
jgi:hypothetical protein